MNVRLLAIAALAAFLALPGCGGGDDDKQDAPEKTQPSVPPECLQPSPPDYCRLYVGP